MHLLLMQMVMLLHMLIYIVLLQLLLLLLPMLLMLQMLRLPAPGMAWHGTAWGHCTPRSDLLFHPSITCIWRDGIAAKKAKGERWPTRGEELTRTGRLPGYNEGNASV